MPKLKRVRLIELMKEKRWTGAALARALFVTRGAVLLWRKNGSISTPHCEALAKLLEVPKYELVEKEGNDNG